MENNSVKTQPFKDIPLTLFKPEWGSDLASIILELEKLRTKHLYASVPKNVFFQLKSVFQMLESIGSARIEGNRTTLAEFVDRVIESDSPRNKDDKMREILNIEQALSFVEDNIKLGDPITRMFLSELHKILVRGLKLPPEGEGSRNPGGYRAVPVAIKNASHQPPDFTQVPSYMEELLNFINKEHKPQDDLLVTALAHHRFAWIHPYDNGNGRAVRMFTYAMLIRQGFRVHENRRILNPTAIFCMDRDRYYKMLDRADAGDASGILAWSEYMLGGLLEEIHKVDKLADRKFVQNMILIPTLKFARERRLITEKEYAILFTVVQDDDMEVKSADLESVIGSESPVQRARIIGKLKDQKMIKSLTEGGRKYTINFENSYLLRGVIDALQKQSFIPKTLNEN